MHNAIRLSWIDIEKGFEKVMLKNNRMVGFFIAKQDSPFYESLAFHRVIDSMKQKPHAARDCRKRQAINYRWFLTEWEI